MITSVWIYIYLFMDNTLLKKLLLPLPECLYVSTLAPQCSTVDSTLLVESRIEREDFFHRL